MSLAERVSQEMGEKGPGASNSLVGYQIRFETKRTDCTCLTYCTTGVLLRKLQIDPLLSDVSHVIVDEVESLIYIFIHSMLCYQMRKIIIDTYLKTTLQTYY